jgi:hypothetical protein
MPSDIWQPSQNESIKNVREFICQFFLMKMHRPVLVLSIRLPAAMDAAAPLKQTKDTCE